ncbi:MAG: hypothetical protein PHF25_04815 [Candidatus Margulisbacteria bacterium]|nr:hypothetical protein [Candidatus Margulisiibacteriota bacterium]
MASCYVCGKSIPKGEECRREVNTGHSFGWSFGKRIVPSTRNYYSKRTLCPECANNHDTSAGIGCLVAIVVFCIFCLFSLINSCAG